MSEDNVHIRITDLTRSYQEGTRQHDVLRRVNVEFARGESVALRGRSGSGKSTLLNLVCGIDSPDHGDVEIAGENITRMSEHDRTLYRRQHIGFVYQAFNLVPTLTVSDNIRLVLELNGIEQKVADERIAELLDAVELAGRAASYPDILSGGEQQRVAIARAIAHQPTLLLADEPTGNLDEKTALVVLDLLDRLARQSAITMIIATHSAVVASRCDRVLELHDGNFST